MRSQDWPSHLPEYIRGPNNFVWRGGAGGGREVIYSEGVGWKDRPSLGSALRRSSPSSRFDATPDHRAESAYLPEWAKPSVLRWLAPVVGAVNHPSATGSFSVAPVSIAFVELAERRLHIVIPRRGGVAATVNDLYTRLGRDDELLFRALELAIENMDLGYAWQQHDEATADLNRTLTESGTDWEVAVDRIDIDERRYQIVRHLERRSPASATDAIASLADSTKRAGEHLSRARSSAYGRDPQPDRAYAEAVKAVEAASIPVVIPNADRPTLGKVIGELRNAPEKWAFVLYEPVPGRFGSERFRNLSSVEVVIVMLDLLWRNHIDRHAVGDDKPARPVSQAQAEFAIHLAIPLVQGFSGRSMRRADPTTAS
jgi:hypothetical protein